MIKFFYRKDKKIPTFRIYTVLQCACVRTSLWSTILKKLDNALLKEPFQISCNICNWWFPILLTALAFHIKMWMLLGIALHGPFLQWTVKGIIKKWNASDQSLIKLSLVFCGAFFCFSWFSIFSLTLFNNFYLYILSGCFQSLSVPTCNDFCLIPWPSIWFMVSFNWTQAN